MANRASGFRPRVQQLEDRTVPAVATPNAPLAGADVATTTPVFTSTATDLVAYGAEAGSMPTVKVYSKAGDLVYTIQAYDSSFKGGVRVATGDVTGDGVADIVTAPGNGMKAQIKVFDGTTGKSVTGFTAYGAFRGGAYVAVGDVNGDGRADIITGADQGGGPHVQAFSGKDTSVVLASFYAFDAAFGGGVRVSAGDINDDGRDDIICGAGANGNGRVRVYDAQSGRLLAGFNAYTAGTNYGIWVSSGDLNGDGRADIIVGAGIYGGTKVKAFSGKDGTLLRTFRADDSEVNATVRVASLDYDGDGYDDIVTSVKGQATVFSGKTGTKLKGYSSGSGGQFVG